jgi:hypothetical protein
MRKALFALCICVLLLCVEGQSVNEEQGTQTIQGTVTDFFGIPWSGLRIRLRAKKAAFKPSTGDNKPLERETVTSQEGRYEFTGLPEDAYEVTLLRVPGVGTLEETKETGIIFGGERIRLDFGVEVGAISECLNLIVGVVTDEHNKPIEGVRVSAFNAYNNRRMLFGTTNRNGAYAIRVCNPGQYIVFADRVGSLIATSAIVLEGPTTSVQADFRLTPLPKKNINGRK